jgi:hypothetical protein
MKGPKIKIEMNYLYKYLFYKILVFVYWVKTKDTQEWSAMFIVSFLICINIGTIYSIIKVFFFPNLHLETPVYYVIFGSVVMIGNYLYFIRGGKHIKIGEEFSNEPNSKKLISTGLTILYIVLTFFSMYFFGEMVRDVNKARLVVDGSPTTSLKDQNFHALPVSNLIRLFG